MKEGVPGVAEKRGDGSNLNLWAKINIPRHTLLGQMLYKHLVDFANILHLFIRQAEAFVSRTNVHSNYNKRNYSDKPR